MKAVIVIPTFNERENIEKLVPVLVDSLKKDYSGDFEILVVDGNSPDGTANSVLELSRIYPQVHLLQEPSKRGLGAAYIFGFKHAMTEMGAEIIMEMDADFQHDPKDAPRLLREIDNGADYVIGSRFIKGGSIPKEWTWQRKFWSVGGNIFAKVVLGIFNVNDFTSGFKVSRVKGFMDRLDLDNVLSHGFAYKIDLLFKMHRLGAKIKEVPIEFGLRDRGNSKMEKNNPLDSLRVVVTLRFQELKSFFKFGVAGLVGFFTDWGIFNIFIWQKMFNASMASLISGFVAMNVTFLLNNFWSFGNQRITSVAKILQKAPLYYLISYIPIYFRGKLLIPWAHSLLGNTNLVSNIALFVGIALGLIWNFAFYKKIIWRKNA